MLSTFVKIFPKCVQGLLSPFSIFPCIPISPLGNLLSRACKIMIDMEFHKFSIFCSIYICVFIKLMFFIELSLNSLN
jgi:hypothetical protein